MTDEQAEARAQRLPEVDRQLFESFRRLGMRAAAALSATSGRDRLPSTDPAEAMAESFEAGFLQQGRTPEQARRMGEAATAGRQGGTLREVRETLSRPSLDDVVDRADFKRTLAEARNVAALLSPAERRKCGSTLRIVGANAPNGCSRPALRTRTPGSGRSSRSSTSMFGAVADEPRARQGHAAPRRRPSAGAGVEGEGRRARCAAS